MDDVLQSNEFDATKTIARNYLCVWGAFWDCQKDLPWLVEKGDALIAKQSHLFTDHVLDQMDTDEFRMMPFNSPAGAELFLYAKDLLKLKEASGDADGILHMIRQPDKDGNVISEEEFRNFFCLLVAAGNDTTRYSIAAGMRSCRQPDYWNKFRLTPRCGKPQRMKSSVGPHLYFRRTLTQDYDAHGKTMKAGDKVLFWFASANRDERAFDDPFRVNLTRTQNKLSFG